MRGGGGDDAMGGGPGGAGAAGAQGAAGQAGAAAQGQRGGAGAAGGGAAAATGGDRANWDAPYIISPHSSTRLYWASNRLYRTDDRGDTWTVISGDLSRNLKREELPIMGKVWPAGSVALNVSTTALSNIVSLDESPLLEGLIWVGTDDGLVQVTEDGGKNWRKIEQFPGVPQYTYVSDVFASPRDANTVFVTLNNWQRGDYKPYIVRSTDRGRTWTNISGNLPDRHDVYSIIQDHLNADLLFAGTEFGLFVTVDGGKNWVQLKGGMPSIQVRDMTVQRRENDLVLATFGRGFYILDDYSALRELTPQALAEERQALPAPRCVFVQPDWAGPGRHRGHRSDGRQLDRAQSVVRRGVHLQPEAGSAGRHEAGADHCGRRWQAGAPDRPREGGWAEACRVGSPRHGGRSRGGCGRGGAGPAWRRRRRPGGRGWRRRPRRAARRWCRPGATPQRSGSWWATSSPPSGRRRASGW